jgi:pimeloyl-ACP methyl ester carboxylesterase
MWYSLATATRAGRGLFRYVLRHLLTLNRLGHALVWIGLLNRTAMRFAELSLSTPEQRKLVYDTWIEFRRIAPDIDRIATLLNQHPVRVRFFTGSFDRIVPGAFVTPLTDQLQQYELTILKTGHNHLIELTMEELGE